MEFRENVDDLMAKVKISGELRRTILEADPANGKHSGKERKKPIWRQAAVPAAAAVLIMSTMYVGAVYLIDHTPLRDIFTAGDDSALPVPENQQRPDIYGKILDDSFSAGGNRAEVGTESGTEADGIGTEENTVQEKTQFPQGKYGEIVMDNELFSIEMLEMTCAGREITASYILTRKTDGNLTVHVSIDNDYLGQWKDGLAGEDYDTGRSLMRSGFGDSFRWNKLPEGCGYELAENQELCIITQLGKTDYASGTYTLYAESFLHEMPDGEKDGEPLHYVSGTYGLYMESYPYGEPDEEKDGESFQLVEIPDGDIQSGFYRTSIEIVRSGDYGFALNGSLDKTEEQVHFDRYEIYVSPLTVYLMMDGTYQGEVDAVWGMRRSHDITIGFADGTETRATVLLSAMGYGKGEIDVDMSASFETAIDPDSIVKVMLDDIVLMGE